MSNAAPSEFNASVAEQNPDFLRTLNEFAVDLMSIPNATDLFWYVARNVAGRLGFVDCVIYTADVETQELTQVAALGERTPTAGRSSIRSSFPLVSGSQAKWRSHGSRLLWMIC